MNAACVWAGEVVVQSAITRDGATTQHEIKENDSAAVGGYTVSVLQILPAPTSSQRIPPSDYRVTLKVAS